MMGHSLEELLMDAFFAGFSEGCDGSWIEGDATPAWKEYRKTLETPHYSGESCVMEDNLFERLTDLSIGTGSLTPIVAIQRIKELEGVLHKIAYWFDTDQEILDNMTAAERDDHIRQHKMVLDALFK